MDFTKTIIPLALMASESIAHSGSRNVKYSPPSEWIMCEVGFFPFFRERSFKSRQNPRVDFFSGKKILRRILNGVFPFTVVEFCGRWIVYNSRLFAPTRGVS